MTKLRIKKEYGTWFYNKVMNQDLDAPIYELYNENMEHVNTFGCYSDMKYYIETGIII